MCNLPVFRTFTNENFGSVRAAKIDGKVFFIEDDVRNKTFTCSVGRCELPEDEKAVIDGIGLISEQGIIRMIVHGGSEHITTIEILRAAEMFRWISDDVIPSMSEPMDVQECLRQLQRQVLDLRNYVDTCVGKDVGIDLVSELHDLIDNMGDMDASIDELRYGETRHLCERVKALESGTSHKGTETPVKAQKKSKAKNKKHMGIISEAPATFF